jgi:hypothetical protein
MKIDIRELSVMFGIPSNGLWLAGFGMCALNMFGYFMRVKVPGYTSQQIIPHHVQGTILPRSRYRMVKSAMEQKCTHLLFIDTDQKFPRDTVHRLLAHKVGVVAANVATKTIPAMPTARYAPKLGDVPYGTPVYTDPTSKGLERVWRVGTGVMLIDLDVFRRTGLHIFDIPWREEVHDYQGEDWSMVEAFEKVGEPIWIDHDLSKEVVHVGYMDYTHDLVGEVVRSEDRRKLVGG